MEWREKNGVGGERREWDGFKVFKEYLNEEVIVE